MLSLPPTPISQPSLKHPFVTVSSHHLEDASDQIYRSVELLAEPMQANDVYDDLSRCLTLSMLVEREPAADDSQPSEVVVRLMAVIVKEF
jgi:hypothetical protein